MNQYRNIMSVFNNWIVKNLLWAIILVVFLAIGTSVALAFVTKHDQEIEVPDMVSLTVPDAEQLASTLGLVVEVTDSVFVRRMEKGAVFSQNPPAGSRVKKGRKVRLTINSISPKKVTMPNLVGYSMRQAKAELASKGLYLGKLVYVKDMATNDVLKQLYRGSEIAPGRSIVMGASIDLVVGLSDQDNKTLVPDVSGMKYMRAVDAVHDNSLNIYKSVFDGSVKTYNDTINAIVFRQSPLPSSVPVDMGSEVSLYLSVDPDKVSSK